MLIQRLVRVCLPAIAFAALAGSFPSCSSSAASGSSDAGDDREAIDLDSTLPPIEASTCDPCLQRCLCTPGDYFFNPARCGNEYCGANGVWGGVSCTVGPGCPADADDGAVCDPCFQVCSCTIGDSFYNPAICGKEVCVSGTWGGSCMRDSACPSEAGEDASFPTDATTDGGSEASTDAASEASGD